MERITATDLKKIAPILDRFRADLIASKTIDFGKDPGTGQLDTDLRNSLGVKGHGIKNVMKALCKYPEYLHVALYYMQYSSGGEAPIHEYQATLANAYGVDTYYSDDLESARALFWERFFAAE